MSLPYHDLSVSNTLLEANTQVGCAGVPILACLADVQTGRAKVASGCVPSCQHTCASAAPLPCQQRERVSYAIKLGWDVVGLAHQAAAKLVGAQDRCGVRGLRVGCVFGGRGMLCYLVHGANIWPTHEAMLNRTSLFMVRLLATAGALSSPPSCRSCWRRCRVCERRWRRQSCALLAAAVAVMVTPTLCAS